MAILNIRPKLLYLGIQGEEWEDEDGHYHTGMEYWNYVAECDVVPASTSESIVTYEDGRTERCDFVIYLDESDHDFVYGERVKVSGLSQPLKVQWAHRYQHQYKIKAGYDGNR